jgi:hypothetical protein
MRASSASFDAFEYAARRASTVGLEDGDEEERARRDCQRGHTLWYWYLQSAFIYPLRDDTLYLGFV